MKFEARLSEMLAGLEIRHACEVGVYMAEDSKILQLARAGTRCTFVEPEDGAFRSLQRATENLNNVSLVNAAISPVEGEVTLVKAGPSTYLQGLRSPAIVNDGLVEESADTQTAKSISFESIDDGTIDYLRVDTEGAEWYVIQNLKSRPHAIVLEMYGRRYLNPHATEIRAWLTDHGYRPVLMDKTDVVFFKRGTVHPSLGDKLCYRFDLLRVYLRLARTRLSVF